MPRRLFLFAAYDPQKVVGEALLWYLNKLSALGDVICVFDNDCPSRELGKLPSSILHVEAERHGEYDFGSYKRAYKWACDNLQLKDYDFLYLLNDSVYGPLLDLKPSLRRMESLDKQAFALVYNPHRSTPHLQSWFLGFRPEVFAEGWFREFLAGVRPQSEKTDVCKLYESGLTELLVSKGCSIGALYELGGKTIYNSPLRLFLKGLPFVKKSAFTRHGGSLGAQLKAVLGHCDQACASAVLNDAKRLYGADYIDKLLIYNPFTMFGRWCAYLFAKLS